MTGESKRKELRLGVPGLNGLNIQSSRMMMIGHYQGYISGFYIQVNGLELPTKIQHILSERVLNQILKKRVLGTVIHNVHGCNIGEDSPLLYRTSS